VGEEFGPNKFSDIALIDSFFRTLHEKTKGLVITDFLDTANWDVIEGYHIDVSTRKTTLLWHDFSKHTEEEEEAEMRRMIFPGTRYGLTLWINNIMPVPIGDFYAFAVNGFSKTLNEIKKEFALKKTEHHIFDDSFFEKRIAFKPQNDWDVFDIHCTPIYSILIIPKNCGIAAHKSRQILYYLNIKEVLERLTSSLSALETMDPQNADAICEKANTIRRSVESLLKLEICFLKIKPTKGYSQILLGDLISLVKTGKDESIVKMLNFLAESLNELSHDTGTPVDIAKAKACAMFAIAYTKLFQYECTSSLG
jgi:hypothetical protein